MLRAAVALDVRAPWIMTSLCIPALLGASNAACVVNISRWIARVISTTFLYHFLGVTRVIPRVSAAPQPHVPLLDSALTASQKLGWRHSRDRRLLSSLAAYAASVFICSAAPPRHASQPVLLQLHRACYHRH